jgi:hypothetical protein
MYWSEKSRSWVTVIIEGTWLKLAALACGLMLVMVLRHVLIAQRYILTIATTLWLFI